MKSDHDRIYEFIRSHSLAVISTIAADCSPQAAVIGFSETEKLDLIIGTFNTSRKYVNLRANPRVAVVIGWEHGQTVQYEGEAHELAGDELAECLKIHIAKMPSAAKYVSKQEQVWFKIVPTWIRYSDISRDPWEKIELNLRH